MDIILEEIGKTFFIDDKLSKILITRKNQDTITLNFNALDIEEVETVRAFQKFADLINSKAGV